MGYKELVSLDCDTTIAVGGKDKNGKPNPTSIEGFFLGSKTVESKMSKTGTAKIHVFQTAQGSVGVWGKDNLDRQLINAQLGAMTLVTFTGFGKAGIGKKPPYKYKIQQDNELTIDVSGVSEGGQDDTGFTDSADVGEDYQETDVDAEESYVEEAPVARAQPPRQAAQAPSAERAAKVQALLKGARTNRA